jgi:hypothetical protein
MKRLFIVLVMLCAMVNVGRALAVEPELPAMTGKEWRNMGQVDKMYYVAGFFEAYFVALVAPNYFNFELVEHLEVDNSIEYLDKFYANVANQNVSISLGLLTLSQAMTGYPETKTQSFIEKIRGKTPLDVLLELQRLTEQAKQKRQAMDDPSLPTH